MKTLMKVILIVLGIYLLIGLFDVIGGAPLHSIVTWGYCWVVGFIQGYTGQPLNPPTICVGS